MAPVPVVVLVVGILAGAEVVGAGRILAALAITVSGLRVYLRPRKVIFVTALLVARGEALAALALAGLQVYRDAAIESLALRRLVRHAVYAPAYACLRVNGCAHAVILHAILYRRRKAPCALAKILSGTVVRVAAKRRAFVYLVLRRILAPVVAGIGHAAHALRAARRLRGVVAFRKTYARPGAGINAHLQATRSAVVYLGLEAVGALALVRTLINGGTPVLGGALVCLGLEAVGTVARAVGVELR